MNEVVIAYITDDNYVMPTIVSINSAIMNKNESSIYKIFIIGVSINEENKKIIDEFISKNINDKIYIEILHFNQHYDFDDTHPYLTSAAIFKFDIANILSDFDKVLYIDCDTVILKDLSELFNIDINDYYAAAVKDYIATEILKQHLALGIKDYFNSGIMLLNTKILIKNKVKEILLDYRSKNHDELMDQNTLNYVFNNRVKFINPKYNYLRTISNYDKVSLDKYFECDTSEDITILHITWLKLWFENIAEEKYFYDFWNYYQHTDYFKNNQIWAVNKIAEQKVKFLENKINERLNILETEANKKYSENWIKFFGIYNNKEYIFIYIFFIKFTIKINEKNINKLAWWIPIRKWRDKFRNKFK